MGPALYLIFMTYSRLPCHYHDTPLGIIDCEFAKSANLQLQSDSNLNSHVLSRIAIYSTSLLKSQGISVFFMFCCHFHFLFLD